MTRKTNDGHGTISHFLAMALLPFLGVVILSSSAATRTWTGAVSSDWFEPGNWTDGDSNPGIPEDGDDVIVQNDRTVAVSVTLTNSTPWLASLKVGDVYNCYQEARITCTNWTTCIRATNITFGGTAKITCSGPVAEIENMSRVWIKCDTLDLKKERSTGRLGAIDVSGKGYATAGKGVTSKGRGPGGASRGCSASHGGHGGMGIISMPSHYFTSDDLYPVSLPYGSAEAPVDPGSSGYSNNNAGSGHGGGVVFIEASGAVTVNGTISADGGNSAAYNSNNTDKGLQDGGGAGGSVYIMCSTFSGSTGRISANGGGGDHPNTTSTAPAGSGGRIAIVYDTSLQTVAKTSGMRISCAPGQHIWRCSEAEYTASGKWYMHSLPLMSNDVYKSEADLGTVWFSDEKLLLSMLGKGLSGQICNLPSTLTVDSLVLTNGHVRFPTDGFTLNVTGDLCVSGGIARLEMGGGYSTKLFDMARAVVRGRRATTLNVGGDMAVASGARVDIRGAETNALDAAGACVSVGGRFNVGNGGLLVVHSDAVTGGSPVFHVGSLNVECGGRISANARGFAGGGTKAGSLGSKGFGPGASASTTQLTYGETVYNSGRYYLGASYGGLGGYCSGASVNNVYGNALLPLFAGSGGCAYQATAYGGCGGGCIHIVAAGAMVVDGLIEADGEPGYSAVWDNLGSGNGSGSGGSIMLEGASFTGAATGCLSAKGGNARVNYRNATPGGGGRIAVYTGNERYDKSVSIRRLKTLEAPIAPEEGLPYAGTYTVAGGTSAYVPADGMPADAGHAADGTVRFVTITPKLGLSIIFR